MAAPQTSQIPKASDFTEGPCCGSEPLQFQSDVTEINVDHHCGDNVDVGQTGTIYGDYHVNNYGNDSSVVPMTKEVQKSDATERKTWYASLLSLGGSSSVEQRSETRSVSGGAHVPINGPPQVFLPSTSTSMGRW
jgi:hypothetical protein